MIHSMTGYASRVVICAGEPYKIELKSLNHRFLDLKIRMPKTWVSLEAQIKTVLEQKIKRGSLEIWIERQRPEKNESSFRINEGVAKAAFQALNDLKHRFQITDDISVRDLMSFPDVVEKNTNLELGSEDEKVVFAGVLEGLSAATSDLLKMRAQEGARLKDALLTIVSELQKAYALLVSARDQIQARAQAKIKKRIEQCFEAYSTTDEKNRALMESRIAQEVSYALEKLDIEEELTRFKGHVDQIEVLITSGGQVGKKLDFMFQELNREVNTLGNKAQDLGVSQEVIELKMKIEQMREQSLNLE